MAFNENIQARSYTAGADLSAKQFTFVSMGAGGTVTSTGLGAAADGVVINNPVSGAAATVVYDGRVQVLSAGTIARNGNVSSNATGVAVASATGNVILGKAYEAAVAGQIFTMEINRAGSLSA